MNLFVFLLLIGLHVTSILVGYIAGQQWGWELPRQYACAERPVQANGNWTYHGLHVHQSGDMSNGCESMGGHFNPYGTIHGSQNDPANRRHVGDFGNVVKDPYGSVQGAVFDNLASLVGRLSILRRGVVLHENRDDLGRGLNDESLRTGNAGRRLACCSIEPI